MKSAAHQYEDKLLEFAYGELPQHEADAVDAHVRGCTKCAESLAEIRGVRATMAQLPMEAAPDAGLDSLLAYAEQAAKRNAEAARPAPSFFKRFLVPLASLAALATVGVISLRANEEFDTSPGAAAAEKKVEEYERTEKKQVAEAQAVLPNEAPAPAPVAVAAAQPQGETNAEPEAIPEGDGLLAQNRPDDRKEWGGKRGYVEPSKPAPQSITRRAQKTAVPADDAFDQAFGGGLSTEKGKPSPKKKSKALEAKQELAQDFSNTGTGGFDKDANSAETKSDLGKLGTRGASTGPTWGDSAGSAYGLGTGSTSPGGAGRVSDDLAKNYMEPRASPPKIVAKEDAAPRDEESRKAPLADPAPAPKPSAPAPSVAPPPPPTQATVPSSRGSFGLRSMTNSPSTPSTADDDQAVQEKLDAINQDSNAKFAERQKQEAAQTQRTNSLQSAREANKKGDLNGEISFALATLNGGATGSQRAEALKRLCDAYENLGDDAKADPYCHQLLAEFPTSTFAEVVTRRRGASQRATPAKAAPSKKATDVAPASAY
jgi:hypothetical protein